MLSFSIGSIVTDTHVVGKSAYIQVGDFLLFHVLEQFCLHNLIVIPESRVRFNIRMSSFVNEDTILHHLENSFV